MYLLSHFKIHYWPAFTCGWIVLTFIISYLTAVLNEHVYPVFPYISDTGTHIPESCIFGQMLNIAAVFMTITMYIRHRQVDFAISNKDVSLKKRWQYFGFWLGVIVCLGVSIVGNFQESNLLSVHLVGAFMAFLGAAFYLIVQTRISFSFRLINYINPKYGVGRKTLMLRILLTVLYIGLVFAVLVFTFLAVNQFTGDKITWWTSDHGGYTEHLAAATSEWLLVLTLMAYVLTLTNEFKSIEFEEIRFINKCTIINSDNGKSAV